MKTINVFTENIFPDWNVDEKDVIEKTKEDSKEIRQIWQNYKKSYSALSRE